MTVIFTVAFITWAFVYLGVSLAAQEMNDMRYDELCCLVVSRQIKVARNI